MGNGPDGLIMSQARDRAARDNLEDASFGLHGGVGGLIENAPHVAVAFWRPVAVVHARALLVSGAGAHPRGELLFGRKGRCSGTDFGNDLLCGVHSQTGHLRQPLDCILVRMEQTGHLLVQLADLLLEELQLLQRHLQEPSVHGLEVRARAERVAQLFRCGAQALIGQSSQSCRVGFSLSQRHQHAPGTGAQQIRD